MNKVKKDKTMESFKQGMIAFLILWLPLLLKNIDWEWVTVTDCNQSITTLEQSFDYTPINQFKRPRKTKLTFEVLKQYKGFENTTETEAEKQIEIIKRLGKILYYSYTNEQQINNYKIG